MPRRIDRPRLRLGMVQLTDAAPLVVAKELNFFAPAGLDVTVSVEPSWANIADKLAYGLLEGAILLPPLAFAISLGLRAAPACPLLAPLSVSLGGNSVTLSNEFAAAKAGDALAASRAFAAQVAARRGAKPVLAVVHAFSTHNLLLRYWLAAGGIDPERDVRLVVVPPARVVEAMQQRRIDGFCAGAPWGQAAERAGLGITVATSHGIWRNGPEKIFALPAAWAEKEPEVLQALLRAMLYAARFCDEPGNAAEIAALLSRADYLDMPRETILASLRGTGGDAGPLFFANAATFPWRSHAQWFLSEMRRWGYLGVELDLPAIAATVYRPDLYATAARAMGVSVPLADRKNEGTHREAWSLPAEPAPIAMGPDLFCDGKMFDPDPAPDRVASGGGTAGASFDKLRMRKIGDGI